MKMQKIRLSKSIVGEEEKQAIARVIDAGYLGMGTEVKLFEEDLQAFLETSKEVICVSTGTAALHLAMQALGIGLGDEVLVPSLTYVATFQAVSATGAKPVACDVTLDKAFIDLKDAEGRLSSKTKAMIPVHYGSNSDGIEAVMRLPINLVYGLLRTPHMLLAALEMEKKLALLAISFALVSMELKILPRVRVVRSLPVTKRLHARLKMQDYWV